MRKTLIRAAAILAGLLAAITLSAASASAGTAGCAGTHGCTAYKLTGIVVGGGAARNVSPNGTALGAPNNAVAGDRLELRNFTTTRASEQFVLNANGELQLGGTSLCVTGRLSYADLETCSAPSVWNSQNWKFDGSVFTNARGRALMVSSDAAYTPVATSSTGHATWAAEVITPQP